jgi:hypothetical protein
VKKQREWREPAITINDVPLTDEQARAVRVAVISYVDELAEIDGESDHDVHLAEVMRLMAPRI